MVKKTTGTRDAGSGKESRRKPLRKRGSGPRKRKARKACTDAADRVGRGSRERGAKKKASQGRKRGIRQASSLAASAPKSPGRAESPWVRDVRQHWQSAAPAKRRKSLQLLAEAKESADLQRRIRCLHAAISTLGMNPTDTTCLVMALYHDGLVAGRADILAQITQRITQALADFQVGGDERSA